jgi:hypothetical protein
VIFEFPRAFPPDEIERKLPDPDAAHALLGGRDAELERVLAERAAQLRTLASDADDPRLVACTLDAARLGYARLGLRHGRFGTDFHPYHNEDHVLEILDGRMGRLIASNGISALDLRQWCALLLFAACHDLRQGETPEFAAGVGANERASIEEAMRLLDACGFSRAADADLHIALDLMICGSTFDARKPDDPLVYNAAEWVQAGGALAGKLDQKLDKHRHGWREDPLLVEGQRLALIAADLDTANVAESFARFAASAANLCAERELISGRSLDATESAAPALAFLTGGQEQFFFDLHRFCSVPGCAAFAPMKQENAPKLRRLVAGLRERADEGVPMPNGRRVLAEFAAVAAEVAA